MSIPYKVCQDCGDHLDAGEICECKRKTATADRATAETARLTPPERAYHGAVIGIDLSPSRDFTPTPCVTRSGT